MATRLYKISPGEAGNEVTQEAGSAVDAEPIELTVDLATDAVNEGGGTRGLKKQEVLAALEKFKNYILANDWPPA